MHFRSSKPVGKSKFSTLFQTRVACTKSKSRMASEITPHPFQVSIKKIAAGITFPAQNPAEVFLEH